MILTITLLVLYKFLLLIMLFAYKIKLRTRTIILHMYIIKLMLEKNTSKKIPKVGSFMSEFKILNDYCTIHSCQAL